MSSDNGISGLDRVQALINQGVIVRAPASVDVDSSVEPSRIAPGVVIHAGCRLSGEQTSIGPGCVIGAEAPVTIENCQLEKNVQLKGGFFSGSVFLDGAGAGSGAHVRPGSLLEEEASVAHTAGLKQTIFLSYVTAGSLVNICDMLVSGGSSRRNHSEIGSSFVHFNFTPHGDKATASLVGDVPRGVLLDQRPIFLGGQGGLVGPARVEYGCLIPAGMVRRKDALEPDQMLFAPPSRAKESKPYHMEVYGQILRVVKNNLIYFGNIRALQVWYTAARQRTMDADLFRRACYEGVLRLLDVIIQERIRRFTQFAEKVALSAEILRKNGGADIRTSVLMQQDTFLEEWPAIEKRLEAGVPPDTGAEEREAFLLEWNSMATGISHIEALGLLSEEGRGHVRSWLQAVVDVVASGNEV